MKLDDWKKAPLLALHRALELSEREIEESLRQCGGESWRRWQDARSPHDVRNVGGDFRDELRHYADLAELATKRELIELASLMAEFRQSDDPTVRAFIAEARALEGRL